MIGIVAGGLVVVGVGIAGLRHAAAPGPDEVAGAAKLRALGDRIPAGGPLSASDSGLAPGVGTMSGQGNSPVPGGQTPVSALAVPRLKVPPSRKGIQEESRRVARERAIAQGKLPEFEAREKEHADREAKKKAERDKRREAFKKRVADRRKAIEAAQKAGQPPPPPEGRKFTP